jgi:hypothetical protein
VRPDQQLERGLITRARGSEELFIATQYSYLLHLPDLRPAFCATSIRLAEGPLVLRGISIRPRFERGSQKIVPNLDSAFQRIQEHVLPYEDARLLETLGIHTAWTRTLILERDFTPGRTTVILVRDPVGV